MSAPARAPDKMAQKKEDVSSIISSLHTTLEAKVKASEAEFDNPLAPAKQDVVARKTPAAQPKHKRRPLITPCDKCFGSQCDYPCCGDEDDCSLKPCPTFFVIMSVLSALLGLGLGLALSGVVETRAIAFIPFYIIGVIAVVCWIPYAGRYTDDDDHGCGFGDYDEGPGTMMCTITSVFIIALVAGGAGGSVAAITAVSAASVNTTEV